MENKLVVLTDLGTFKAYRLEENELHSTPRLELISEFETIAGKESLVELTTDMAGRFPTGAGAASPASVMSAGERHNIELEQRRRLVKQMAERINQLMLQNQFDGCCLAAGKGINKMLWDELSPAVRGRIDQNILANLTHLDKLDLLRHLYPERKF